MMQKEGSHSLAVVSHPFNPTSLLRSWWQAIPYTSKLSKTNKWDKAKPRQNNYCELTKSFWHRKLPFLLALVTFTAPDWVRQFLCLARFSGITILHTGGHPCYFQVFYNYTKQKWVLCVFNMHYSFRDILPKIYG